jgi:hypothetical protein
LPNGSQHYREFPGETPAAIRNMVATRLIVRLGPKNRMVTKDYQRGVYVWGWGKGGFENRSREDFRR